MLINRCVRIVWRIICGIVYSYCVCHYTNRLIHLSMNNYHHFATYHPNVHHINQSINNKQASPEGQKIFDKLLKACNEVSWRGESIIVLGEIRVDPPYTSNDCALIGKGGGLDGHSLERVKNIVNAAAVK